MSKVESFSVLTLTCQKTDFCDHTRPTCFYFEDYYLHQGKMNAYSLIILFGCGYISTTVAIVPELKSLDM